MERLAVNELTTFRWPFEVDVERYVEAGIAGIGVWRQKLTDFGEKRGNELLRKKGLAVSSLHWAGGFTGSEGSTHRESINDAREAIRQAANLSAGCLVLYTGARAGHTRNHARRLMRNALKDLAPLAEEQSVMLAIEPMHEGCAEAWTFLTDLDETLELLDAAACPAVKLCFDIYHLAHDESVLERLAEIAPMIALVQLGDARRPPSGEQDRCPLGQGMLPVAEIVAALRAAGYGGYYEIELMGEEFEGRDYAELIQDSRDAFCRYG